MSTYRKVDSDQGLILVYSEPGGNVAEEEFNGMDVLILSLHLNPRLIYG